jgi:hypothetical protein
MASAVVVSSPDSVSAESGLFIASPTVYVLGHEVNNYLAFFLGHVYRMWHDGRKTFHSHIAGS